MTIPKDMQGLVLLHQGLNEGDYDPGLYDLEKWVGLKQIPVPRPKPGQVLIRVSHAAFNHSDIAFIKGFYGLPRVEGQAAGFEGTGVIVAGDTPLLGKRVSFASPSSGTWAEYAIADIAQLIPLQDKLRDEDAAGLIINPVSAAAMFEVASEGGTKSFVATAAGSQVGKFLISLGREKGCPCIAIVRRQELEAPLKHLGALDVLVASEPDFKDRFKSISAQFRPRIMLDAVADQVSSNLFFAMPRNATWVIYGRLTAIPPCLDEPEQFITANKTITGFWLTSWFQRTPPEKVSRVINEVQARFIDGRWRTDVVETVMLNDAMSRLPIAAQRKDGKVLISA